MAVQFLITNDRPNEAGLVLSWLHYVSIPFCLLCLGG